MQSRQVEISKCAISHARGFASRRALIATAVAFLQLLASPRAKADLSLVSNDTIYGTNISLASGATITGNVGVGPNGSLSTASGNASSVSGTIFTATGATVTSVTSGPGGTGTPSPDAALSGANAAIQTASSGFAAMPATPLYSGDGGNKTFAATGTTTVIDLSTISSGTITLQGTSSDTFIINVSGSLQLNGGVVLQNGLLASHVLFNVTDTNTSDLVQLSGTLNGTFLVPNLEVEITGGSQLNGAILDGSTVSIDVQDKASSEKFVGTGNLFNFPTVAAPEPGTIGLAVSGLVAVGLVRLARGKRSR